MSRDLHGVDEMLQIMFWLRNEGLSSDVAAADVARFAARPANEIAMLLQAMAGLGYLQTSDGVRYTLTDEGAREGARRFADEFADYTKPGHGECGDPDCECHETGSAADCRHRTAELE